MVLPPEGKPKQRRQTEIIQRFLKACKKPGRMKHGRNICAGSVWTKKILKRINAILKDIDRSPFSGIGKPEPLRYTQQGYWSRRIDAVNRIVYKVENGQLLIVQCGTHYGDE